MANLRHAARSLFRSNNGGRVAPEWIGLQLFSRRSRTPTIPPSDVIGDLETPPTLPRMKLADTRALSIFHSLARTSQRATKAWTSRFPGWRGGLASFVALASLVLIINLTGLIWAVTHLDDNPFATITMRSCDEISQLGGYSSLVINVLSTTLLAASNYCMQCLTSPTRAEVDAAHAAGKSLRIGALSWRNVFRYRKRRMGLLVALLLSSLPLFSIYNYAVIPQMALQPDFYYVWVTPDFLNGAGFNISSKLDLTNVDWYWRYTRNHTVDEYFHKLQDQIWRAELWENMSVANCMQKYQVPPSDLGTVLLVTEKLPDFSITSSVTSIDVTKNVTQSLLKIGLGNYGEPYPWEWQYRSLDEWRRMIPGWRTVYCLARKATPRCRLQVHVWFLLVVVILNIIKLGCLLRTFWEQQDAPFINMGDAIASFLQRPCQLTKGSCLLTQSELTKHLQQEGDNLEDSTQTRPRRYEARAVRLYSSISYLSWSTYIIVVMFALLAAASGFNKIIIVYRDNIKPSLSIFWKSGFGKLNLSLAGVLHPDWCTQSPTCSDLGLLEVYNMFAGSLPQIVVALAYFLLNAYLTQIVQLQEWLRLEQRRQALRVTTPEPNSEQTSTYWLSLPYRYSIPQILSSMMLSWLASHTVFFTRFKLYVEDGNHYDYPVSQTSPDEIRRIFSYTYRNGEWGLYCIGYSPLGVICTALFGILIFVVSIVISLKKRTSGLPLGPSNSLVLAAACHPPENDRYAARNQIQWGAVHSRTRARGEPYHCTISSRKVEVPVEGRFYA